MNRYLKYAGIGLGVILGQVTIADWIQIQQIKPDLMMLFILYLAYREGRSVGVIFGFLFGVILDLGTASDFIGLSALVYSVVGFGSGFLQGRFHTLNPIVLYIIALAVLLTGHFIYFGIYYSGSPIGLSGLAGRFIFPAFAYTAIIGTLALFTMPLSVE